MAASSLYGRVYDQIKARILDGTYPVDSRLPTSEELTTELQVSAITLKRALDMLRDEGFVVRRPRLGTVVVSADPGQSVHRRDGLPLVRCIVTGFDDTFGTPVLIGLLDAAAGRAHIVLDRSVGDTTREDRLLAGAVDMGAEAVLLLPSSSEYASPALLELVTRQFPVVVLDRGLEQIPVSTVRSDNVSGAQAATEHLFSLGHRQVGLVASASAVSTIDERRQGFVRAHAVRGYSLDPDRMYGDVRVVVPGADEDPTDDLQRLTAFLRRHDDLTGFVVTEYHVALLVRRAVRELGLRIPRDVSIVCFDQPDSFLDDEIFRFTHVAQPQVELGRRALDLVLAQIEDPTAVVKLALPTRLVVGESSGPARQPVAPPIPSP
ncbi:GntR family transcriptional regulator [Kineococcus sp. SYSU DK003]|uniref:GntR family transcriptional regulator n=1 Tax=Kineococcus sp. SYSU DK003 TaxID=3383124 RepID=UPI003D7DD9D4